MGNVLPPELRSLLAQRNVDRRTFVVTTLGAGFAAAVLPVGAQTITTPADGLTAGEVKVPAKGGAMAAYRAMPASGGPFPTILVVSEIFGVHEHIRDVCRRFAKLGYYAIAPELFARQGDAGKYTDVQALLKEVVARTPDGEVMGDLDAAVAFARSEGKADVGRLGITGFCWGGRITLMYAAHNRDVDAAVAWYGPTARAYYPNDRTPLDVAAQVRAPVLGLYGGADAGIPNDTVEKFFAALKAAGNAKSDLVIYPDTPHAFHADYRPTYRKDKAEDGWKRATAWFKQHLG
ncbi:MAG: dienelactone hydrolase family protein [Burkholderiales bacterium]|nr:dienelactone hydrolase family protein [Burkholderiales bacterium]GIK87383.1 MAG: carboxymethylenebutenolidase [Betaproteobacteria bacterium]